MPTVSLDCSGNASAKHVADIATINIEVSAKEDDSDTAVRNVLDTSQNILNELRAVDGPLTKGLKKHHRARLSTHETREYEQNVMGLSHANLKSRVYHHASTKLTIQYDDFDSMSNTVWHLAKLKFVSIRRVEWSLLPETISKSKSELRTRATQDAIQTAREFFHAAGVTSFHLVQFSDNSTRSSANRNPYDQYGPYGPPQVQTQAAMSSKGVAEGPINYEPEEIEIIVKITTKFEAQAPEFN